jgi:threonyl-tRNA synthetase
MIHRAILGSYERFLAILIEHFAGNFPVWLAPEQVRLLTVNDSESVSEKAAQMQKALKESGVRVELDDSNESVGKKIREASLGKVPYTIVVGEKEVENGEVSPRIRADLGSAEPKLNFDDFVKKVVEEIAGRSAKSTL